MVSKILKILYYIGFVILLIVAGIIVLSTVNVPGNIKLFSVQSGSMEPTIKTGSIVIVKPADTYQIGDVITVSEVANSKITVTHRIAEIEVKDGATLYITKGDANNSNDIEKRASKDVLGKVVFYVPVLGYIVSFAKTKEGLLILIVVPAVIIIFSELLSIRDQAKKFLEQRKAKTQVINEELEVKTKKKSKSKKNKKMNKEKSINVNDNK